MTVLERSLWQELIRDRCGQSFSKPRLRVLRQALWQRMSQRGILSYTNYYHYVAFHHEGPNEWPELLDLLLNKETSFFRHTPSFDALMKHVLPELKRVKYQRGENSLRLWSAGCSTGQEAYSLAMACQGAEGTRGWKIQVLGTDLSTRALERAREARYRPHESRFVPDSLAGRFVRIEEEAHGVTYQVTDEICSLVEFASLNLSAAEYPVPLQDVVFCQNVLIYFQPEDRVGIARKLCARLNRGGYLFLAPAEAVGLRLPGIVPVSLDNAMIYQRVE